MNGERGMVHIMVDLSSSSSKHSGYIGQEGGGRERDSSCVTIWMDGRLLCLEKRNQLHTHSNADTVSPHQSTRQTYAPGVCSVRNSRCMGSERVRVAAPAACSRSCSWAFIDANELQGAQTSAVFSLHYLRLSLETLFLFRCAWKKRQAGVS